MKEVAFFDTYPLNDAQTYNGAWNNYPFFASGNIIVSDIDGGLFVLRADLPPNPGKSIKDTRFDQNIVQLIPEPGGLGALTVGLLSFGYRRRARGS